MIWCQPRALAPAKCRHRSALTLQQTSSTSSRPIGGRTGGGFVASRPVARIRSIRESDSAPLSRSLVSNHSLSITSSRRGQGDSKTSIANVLRSFDDSRGGLLRMDSATRWLSGRTDGCRLAGSVSHTQASQMSCCARSRKPWTHSRKFSGYEVSVSRSYSSSLKHDRHLDL